MKSLGLFSGPAEDIVWVFSVTAGMIKEKRVNSGYTYEFSDLTLQEYIFQRRFWGICTAPNIGTGLVYRKYF